ncbi:uncharacterized protein LOC129737964 [Uranotaenia lowii]|uniref:uncharacterized protein LOC129737964 n=1 Tax=Uranotaenia lowii TaxID=190385 RepID=UPI00247982C7|nr:uncharacterized protein LOC129737964 [Uranotaenia lowii]
MQTHRLVVGLAFVAFGAYGATQDEVISVSLNSRKVIGRINEKFVSFSANPRDFMDASGDSYSDASLLMARKLSPMFLKVLGDSTSNQQLQTDDIDGNWQEDSELIQLSSKGWNALNELMVQTGVPIFVLDYKPDSWTPKNALRMLSVAKKLGVNRSLWQLGDGNVLNKTQYIDDLRVFRTMVKAFDFMGVVANEVGSSSAGFDTREYFNIRINDVADAVAVNFEPTSIDDSLETFIQHRGDSFNSLIQSQLPLWLDLKIPSSIENNFCDDACLQNGLHYATILGDAARSGFDAVFKSLSRTEIQTPTFSFLIALLHRNSVGTKVFDISSHTGKPSVYGYCSRGINGSLTIMAVNNQPEERHYSVKHNIKKYSTEVQHFVATVSDGIILLNGASYDPTTLLKPVVKIEPLLKELHLSLPGSSVGFWIVPDLNLHECSHDDEESRAKFPRDVSRELAPITQLLRELINERDQLDLTQQSRRKRSLGEEDALEKELERKLTKHSSRKVAGRSPRQTRNFRRKQRTIRKKEKRADRRDLKKQKRPLMERIVRNRVRRLNPFSSSNTGSKKTKRSFLAEAVHHPPHFSNNSEEEADRSGFPQGDVHLVISKDAGEAEHLSIDRSPIRETRPKKSRKSKYKESRSESERALKFFIPEMALMGGGEARPKEDSTEMDMASSFNMDRFIRSKIPMGQHMKPPKVMDVDRDFVEVRDIKVMEPGVAPIHQSKESTEKDTETDSIDPEGNYKEEPEEDDVTITTTTVSPAIEAISESEEESNESEMDVFTESPESLPDVSYEDTQETSNNRKKRSITSDEITRIEAFFVNNTDLQQKFTELFELMLQSFDCCGDSTENSAREDLEDTPRLRRKRNALLHPKSWESRERSNMIHQQRSLSDSHDDALSTELFKKGMKVSNAKPSINGPTMQPTATREVTMLRSVTKFVQGMSSDFHRLFSSLFTKISTE